MKPNNEGRSLFYYLSETKFLQRFEVQVIRTWTEIYNFEKTFMLKIKKLLSTVESSVAEFIPGNPINMHKLYREIQ